jgi:hypothetical protein
MTVMDDVEHIDAPLDGRQQVRLLERLAASVVGPFAADAFGLADVTDVWVSLDRVERLVSGAKTLLAARVEESGSWKRAGARSAADHLARLGGTSTNVARRALINSKELPDLPEVAETIRAGGLSNEQVDAIVPAAAANPSAAGRLLGLAGTTNVSELRDECLRTRAAADPDPDATHDRIRNNRYLRTRTDAEGAWNLSARGTAEDGARFEHALAPFIDEMFTPDRDIEQQEPRDAYAFDALMALTDHEPVDDETSKSKPKMRFLALLQLPYELFMTGAVDGEEMCEIVGIGPVPVRVARDLLGESILKLVITKGVDVANVVHLGRGPTMAQRIALLWSKPKCANAACSSMFVQIDHREPWAETHHTTLDELDPLCPHDHDLKTNHGWSLVAGKGRRAIVAPDDPRHPRNRPPP